MQFFLFLKASVFKWQNRIIKELEIGMLAVFEYDPLYPQFEVTFGKYLWSCFQHTHHIKWKHEIQLPQKLPKQQSVIKQEEGTKCSSPDFLQKITTLIQRDYSTYKRLKEEEKYTNKQFELYHTLRTSFVGQLKKLQEDWELSGMCKGCQGQYQLRVLDSNKKWFQNLIEDKFPGKSGPATLYKVITRYLQDLSEFEAADKCINSK